jgi:hypothetical protein
MPNLVSTSNTLCAVFCVKGPRGGEVVLEVRAEFPWVAVTKMLCTNCFNVVEGEVLIDDNISVY